MTNNNFSDRNKILKEIYSILIKNKISFVCIGRHFYSNNETGDIDILFAKENISASKDLIRNFLKKLDDVFFLERPCIATSNIQTSKFLVEINGKFSPILQIDMLDSLHYKGLIYADFRNLKNFIKRSNNTYILQGDFHKYIGIIKDILYKNEINFSRKISEVDLSELSNFLYRIGFSKNLSSIFIISFFKKFSPKTIFIIMWLKRINFYYLKGFLFFYINFFKAFFKGIYKNKMIIFYGPDGVGKSFLIEKISQKEILFRYFDEVNLKHTKPRIIPPLSLIKKYLKREVNINNKPPRDTKSLKKCTAIIHFLYYSLDYFIEKVKLYLESIYPKRKLYIYDRYFYEMAYQQTFKNLPNKFLYLFKYISYKPLINFFVLGNPKIIFKRKQELSLDEIKYQIDKFKYIDKKYSLNTEFIDNTNKEIELTIKNIMDIIKTKI